jgi:hypothetical protein
MHLLPLVVEFGVIGNRVGLVGIGARVKSILPSSPSGRLSEEALVERITSLRIVVSLLGHGWVSVVTVLIDVGSSLPVLLDLLSLGHTDTISDRDLVGPFPGRRLRGLGATKVPALADIILIEVVLSPVVEPDSVFTKIIHLVLAASHDDVSEEPLVVASNGEHDHRETNDLNLLGLSLVIDQVHEVGRLEADSLDLFHHFALIV